MKPLFYLFIALSLAGCAVGVPRSELNNAPLKANYQVVGQVVKLVKCFNEHPNRPYLIDGDSIPIIYSPDYAEYSVTLGSYYFLLITFEQSGDTVDVSAKSTGGTVTASSRFVEGFTSIEKILSDCENLKH